MINLSKDIPNCCVNCDKECEVNCIRTYDPTTRWSTKKESIFDETVISFEEAGPLTLAVYTDYDAINSVPWDDDDGDYLDGMFTQGHHDEDYWD